MSKEVMETPVLKNFAFKEPLSTFKYAWDGVLAWVLTILAVGMLALMVAVTVLAFQRGTVWEWIGGSVISLMLLLGIPNIFWKDREDKLRRHASRMENRAWASVQILDDAFSDYVMPTCENRPGDMSSKMFDSAFDGGSGPHILCDAVSVWVYNNLGRKASSPEAKVSYYYKTLYEWDEDHIDLVKSDKYFEIIVTVREKFFTVELSEPKVSESLASRLARHPSYQKSVGS